MLIAGGYNSVAGGTLDISPRFADNIMADALVSEREDVGENNRPIRTQSLQTQIDLPVIGHWFPVPAAAFRKIQDPIAGRLMNYRIEWTLPSGRVITFWSQRDLSPQTNRDIQWTRGSFFNDWELANVTVRATGATAPGLAAHGIITQEQAERVIGAVVNDPPPTTDTIPSAVKSASGALIILAIVAAAIYFLPRTGG